MDLKPYLGVRRVSRLEYLVAFLRSVQAGYNHEDARRRIKKIQEGYEAEKAKVLGRQKPRQARGASILPECAKMAAQLQFTVRKSGDWVLTPDGETFLQICPNDLGNFPNKKTRLFLVIRMWKVYPRIGQTILAMLSQPDGEMTLPLRSFAGSFRQIFAQKYHLDYDVVTFNTIREIGTQLELLNWYITEVERKQIQCVYPIVCVATLGYIEMMGGHAPRIKTPLEVCLHEIGTDLGALTVERDIYIAHTLKSVELVNNAVAKGYLTIEPQSDYVFVKHKERVDVKEFEQVLWELYLEKSGNRTLFPVLYSDLRNAVCRRLRLPDRIFNDTIMALIEKPLRIRIYPSGGVLDYANPMAHRHKYIPPKTRSGHFITYLKINRLD